jgi:hypothetical protein
MKQAVSKQAAGAVRGAVVGIVILAFAATAAADATPSQNGTDGSYYITRGPLALRELMIATAESASPTTTPATNTSAPAATPPAADSPAPAAARPRSTVSLGNSKILAQGLKFEVSYQTQIGSDGSAAGATNTIYSVIRVIPIINNSDKRFANTTYINSEDNDKHFAIAKQDFDRAVADGLIEKQYSTLTFGWNGVTFGTSLKLPFKLRPRLTLSDGTHRNRAISSDISLGAHVGLRTRISHVSPYYAGLVFTVGLALLPISADETKNGDATTGTTTVPGLTAAGGVIIELGNFQLGVLAGKDYASGPQGASWLYNNQWWYSVAVGFAFVGNPGE